MKDGAASELQVEIPQLRAFGTHFHSFGVSNVGQTGQATRVEAGRTADMDGLLDVIAPAIHETAVVFGNHYDRLARVVAGAAIDAVLEPLRAETDRVDRELRGNHEFLEERRRRRVDTETRDLLARAAESPQAPDSLRRLAGRVAGGEITWDDVFAHRAGPDGDTFLADAFRTAEQQFGDADLTPVAVPEEALETGADPDEIADDIDRTRREARDEHDAVSRRAFGGGA